MFLISAASYSFVRKMQFSTFTLPYWFVSPEILEKKQKVAVHMYTAEKLIRKIPQDSQGNTLNNFLL